LNRLRGHRACVFAALTALALSACAGVIPDVPEAASADDVWDASLLPVRRIDLNEISFDSRGSVVSGIVSAVAVRGDLLYVIDAGSRRVLEVSLATESLRELGTLRDGSSQGLLAADDGRVYALDPADRSILVLDPFTQQHARVLLDEDVASPVDLTLLDGQGLAVADRLDGRLVLLNVPGGVSGALSMQRAQHPVVTAPVAVAFSAGEIFVLDDRADEVVSLDRFARPTGIFASGDLHHARAMAVDRCRRFFVSDGNDGSIYIGIPDMSIPGVRVEVESLAGTDVIDLWTDGAFLYAATRLNGIYVYLVDPGCD